MDETSQGLQIAGHDGAEKEKNEGERMMRPTDGGRERADKQGESKERANKAER